MDHPLPPSIWCYCPGECRSPAEVIKETVLQSTSGPVVHVWTICVNVPDRHRFFLPLELVVLME